MKRLLLGLLALHTGAITAGAETLEDRVKNLERKLEEEELARDAAAIATSWRLRGQDSDEAKTAAKAAARAVQLRFRRLGEPACIVLLFEKSATEADRKVSLDVMKKRLAAWGAEEAMIVSHDSFTIEVLLGSANEKSTAPRPAASAVTEDDRRLLGKTGAIEFRLEATKAQQDEWKTTGVAPAGTVELKSRTPGGKFLALAEIALDASAIETIASSSDGGGAPAILLSLTKAGAARMEKLSSENLDRALAILLGGDVVSAPVIHSTMKDKVMVSGQFDQRWVDRLVATVKAGTLPAPLQEIGFKSNEDSNGSWEAAPAGSWGDRLVASNVVHAVLEQLLRDRQPEAYAAILKEIEKR